MPRDGTGVYSRPPGVDAVPDTTVESSKYNLNVADVEFDLNLARPIVAGGTGGSTPDQARGGLGAEKAAQVVVNFDAHIWFPGSFRHAATAANVGQPVIDHAFDGISYTSDAPGAAPDYIPLNQNVTVVARDQTDTSVPGRVYVRQKKAGVWSAWAIDQSGMFVLKAGDVMSGDLTIRKVTPALFLDKTDIDPANSWAAIQGQKLGLRRWQLDLGDGLAEAVDDVGSDFGLHFFHNDGSLAGSALKANRKTGLLNLIGDPVDPLHAVPKRYVDNAIAAVVAGLAINLSFKVTASSGSLTVALKTQAGDDPSPTTPVTVAFKNIVKESSPDNTGVYTPLVITAPVSFTLATGSQMGVGPNIPCRLWVGLFNVSGVPQIGLINCMLLQGTSSHILGIKESGYTTLNAQGVDGADAYHTWYGAVGAGPLIPYRVIGSMTWETAKPLTGIWVQPNNIDTITANTVMPGSVVQARGLHASGGSFSGTAYTLVPNSQLVIAPKSAANLIFVSYSGTGVATAAGVGQDTFYQSRIDRDAATLGAGRSIAVVAGTGSGANVSAYGSFAFTITDVPMTRNPVTYQMLHSRTGIAGSATTSEITAQVLEIQG